MSGWSLHELLAGLHDKVEQSLNQARKSFAHSGTKGDASEAVWVDLLNTYLPKRYQVDTAHVVDSHGSFSQQIDVVIYDRQYTPLIFEMHGIKIIPAESVYAIFEAKQTINAMYVGYARDKAASVRKLDRTSLAVPWLGGKAEAKKPHHILSGILTFESDWSPPMGKTMTDLLDSAPDESLLDIGCVAAHGWFGRGVDGQTAVTPGGKPATALLMELIARLQEIGTVPMIDVRAYARWLIE
ncbi:DUF6602 domain-containing protein [Mesorhizobium erdmanii]|uniref:DUF6602 domain-containing protein n=1 Tax=Mesorhizobium erdmanii TaxID=1777866 RepID=A0A6M7UR84_9HYPH|nr:MULTISPECIES: DUF6602 domain-containing protein [Mesorhizobium]OBQ67983.1 hypothetical protein A8146_11245 [Mesorhizobium loti]QKC79402.1 hypothetical protein EB233_31535 [Mesorhizobium erdmanii]